MSDLELILNMLAESTTTEISRQEEPENFDQNRKIAKRGGNVAGQARKNIEAETGKPVVTHRNAVDFAQLIGDVIEEKNDAQTIEREEIRKLRYSKKKLMLDE